MKGKWSAVLLSFGLAFIASACGGEATTAPSAVPTDRSIQAAGSTPTVTAESKYTWEVVVVDDNGAKPSLALDSLGTPHIAYLLEAMPGFVKYAAPDANGWDVATVATGYFYGPLDIQVDKQGAPRIAWHNHDEENEAYAALVDGQWVLHDIDSPGHDGWDNSLAIDSAGLPHTVSIDPVQFGSASGVEYATFDGDTWTVEQVGSGPVPYEFGTALALDSKDVPHAAWFDDSGQELRYAVKDGSTWKISTVDSDGDVGRFPSLVLGSNGYPTISYYEQISDTTGYIKIAQWNGDEWDIQRIDKLENAFLGHFGARKNSSLVLDASDNPIVAYSDEEVVKLAWWDGSQWNLETVQTADGTPFGQQVSLDLGGDGVLHLAFADVEAKRSPGVKGAVQYARGTPRED